MGIIGNLRDNLKYYVNIERIGFNLLKARLFDYQFKKRSDEYFNKAWEIARKTIPIAERLGKPTEDLEVILRA